MLEKVVAFITRPTPGGGELLLFRHPYAGIQIPGGTVEEGESPAEAALREAREESGITQFGPPVYLGHRVERPAADVMLVARATHVYARPDLGSFDWAYLRKGIQVKALRKAPGFTQVCYEEFDQLLDPQYITLAITAWAPDEALSPGLQRHFFHLETSAITPERWKVAIDNHVFTLFWAPLDHLPDIISPQDEWLAFLPRARG